MILLPNGGKVVKYRIKEIIRDYGKEKSWKEKQHQRDLQKRYNLLINNPQYADSDAIKTIETQIKKYETDVWKKAQVRVRNVMKNEGEKPSKFFLNLEKQQIDNGKIYKFLTPDGNYADQADTLLDCANSFYSNLYKSEEISDSHLKDIVSNINNKDIYDDIYSNLEDDITDEEIKIGLFEMNKSKSPGYDGLTVEFYQTFWHIIGSDILQVFNYCFRNGRLCDSMNCALIRLIYKKSGDRHDLKNWRPISLLAVDYKILSKVITNRLKRIMPNLVGEEQTCGVAGRKIHDNLMLLRDVIDYVNFDNLDAALVSVDQEKAFDRISWKYMFNIMYKMNIPPTLIQWIKLLYSRPNSRIIITNFIGSPIQVKRGIRQGCPLSPLLYAICAEGLAALIRNNGDLNGIASPKGECNIRLIQHADDTSLFISNNNEFSVINNILDNYSKGSGSKINHAKSKMLFLGNWKNRQDKPCDFNLCDKMKILGIIVGNDVTPDDNWGPE